MAKRKPPGGRLARKSRLRKKKRKYMYFAVRYLGNYIYLPKALAWYCLTKPEVTSGSEKQ